MKPIVKAIIIIILAVLVDFLLFILIAYLTTKYSNDPEHQLAKYVLYSIILITIGIVYVLIRRDYRKRHKLEPIDGLPIDFESVRILSITHHKKTNYYTSGASGQVGAFGNVNVTQTTNSYKTSSWKIVIENIGNNEINNVKLFFSFLNKTGEITSKPFLDFYNISQNEKYTKDLDAYQSKEKVILKKIIINNQKEKILDIDMGYAI